jgi:hypothetical protein
MRFHRRQLLRILSFAFGSSFTLSRDRLGIAAQTGTQPMTSPPAAGAVVRNGVATGAEMEKVTGIGAILPSARSESVGELVPAAPGSLAHTIELRGTRLGARGRPHGFRSFS